MDKPWDPGPAESLVNFVGPPGIVGSCRRPAMSGVWGVSWQWRALVASWFEKCTLAAFF